MRNVVKFKKAFTLIELLVVISIVALLLSILVPALTKVKDSAKRVVCATNMSTITKGIFAYCANNNDKLPASGYNGGDVTYNNPDNSSTGDSFTAPWAGTLTNLIDTSQPFGSHLRNAVSDRPGSGTYGCGKLYAAGIVDEPEAFYCPAVPKRGGTAFNDYSYRYDAHIDPSGRWPWNNNTWSTSQWMTFSSYYYTPFSRKKNTLGFPAIAVAAQDLQSTSIMGLDMILDIGYMPHKKSKKGGGGVNAFYGDGHVEFRNDREAFNYAFDPANWRSSMDSLNHHPEMYATFLEMLR